MDRFGKQIGFNWYSFSFTQNNHRKYYISNSFTKKSRRTFAKRKNILLYRIYNTQIIKRLQMRL